MAEAAIRKRRAAPKKRFKATAPAVCPSQRKRRRCYGPLPEPDTRADLYWGVNQPELRGVTDGQLARLILDSPEFAAVFGPQFSAIAGRSMTGNGKNAGRPINWSARQLESLLIYRRVSGLGTIKRTLERLAYDREAQRLLGFTTATPSAATVTRHLRQHFSTEERRDLYRELDRRLRQRVVTLPGFDEEARKLGLDGSQHGTVYTPPRPEVGPDGKLTGKFRNTDFTKGTPGAITAPDAGIVGKDGGPKTGQGWQFIGLFSEHGTLIGWDISPLHKSERAAAERVLNDYKENVLPHRDPKTLSVCTADGGFSSPALRHQMQALRIAPNIHKASHGGAERSMLNVARLNADWLHFEHPSKPHYRQWMANGHGEIVCQCGLSTSERIFNVTDSGHLAIATRGHCKSCGTVTITAGKWRRAQNPARYVRAFNGDGDPAVGNSLTFNDGIAREYGKDRFGWGESVHATLERRFGLLKQKSWMRSKTEVETEFAIAASAISVLLLERERRVTAVAAVGTQPVQ